MSAPPAPLTATNLAEHTEQKENYVQPPPTVDERLMQARNFLSDEDFSLSEKYRKHYWEIESLLCTLSDEKIPCDSSLFRQVRDMLRVHKARMDQLDNPTAELVGSRQLTRYSTRLPTKDPAGMVVARHALRKEDHPPFTIDRKPDHTLFVRAFRINDKAGKRLREVERLAYFQTLKNPSLANEDLEENTYEERALKRGRRRAALQLALRAIGGNEEQTFEAGSTHRIVSLPQPPTVKAEEPRMCQALPESERPAEPDRFAWTKRNIKFQQGQSQLVTWVNDERTQNRVGLRDSDRQLPTKPLVFYKPTQKQSIVAHRRERRIARLAQVAFGILVRVSYDLLSKGIEDAQEPSSPEAQVLIEAMTQGLIHGDAEDSRDVPTATQIVILQQLAKAGGQWLQNVADGDMTPLDETQLVRLENCSVESLSRLDEDTLGLLQTLHVELLDLIHSVENGDPSNYSEDRNRDKETLKTFREDVAGCPSDEGLANSLNTMKVSVGTDETKSLVTDQILTENNKDVRDRRLDHRKIWSFSTALPEISKIQNYFSMEKWPTSRSVQNPQTATQTTTGKRKAMTELETAPATKRLRDEYTPQGIGGNRKTTEAEAASGPKRSAHAVDYRSLDPTDKRPSRRLAPDEIGFQVVKEESHPHENKLLRIGAGDLMPPEIKDFDVQKHGQILENAPDPREKRMKGKARFPFGETSTTSLALNTRIRLDLGSSKRLLSSRQFDTE